MKLKILATALILFSASAYGFSLSDYFTGVGSGEAALIELDGTIQPSQSSGFGAGSGINPEQVRELNQKAKDQGAEAIVYEINSGGGAVVASKDVQRSVENVDVPTVCRLRDVGASGAYLLSLGCDEIVADSATFTGSVGVTGSYFQFTDLMDEVGVDYINITAGDNKEVGSPFQEITDEEREILLEQVDQVHEEFYTTVDDNRNLTEEQLEEVKTGKIFLGEEAQELGLVDELGGRETAFNRAENITDKELRFRKVRTTPQFDIFSLLTMAVPQNLMDLMSSSDTPFRAEI